MPQDAQQTADQLAAQQMEDDPQIVKLAGDFYVAKFFIYLANFVFAGAGGTVRQSITIDSDADFEMLYLTGNATGADASDQSGFITVYITEGSAGGLRVDGESGELQQPGGRGAASLPDRADSAIAAEKTSVPVRTNEHFGASRHRADLPCGIQALSRIAEHGARRSSIAELETFF